MLPSGQGPSSYAFGSAPHSGLASSKSLKSGSLRPSKERGSSSHSTNRAEEKDRTAWPELRWLQTPPGRPSWPLRAQSQPGRLEPQILGQEHGEDAAEVVHRGGVQVGLRVARRVPDGGEGHGDEVEHRDAWRREKGRLVRPTANPGAQTQARGNLPRPPPRRYGVLASEEL